MKNLKDIIQEKLVINKNVKVKSTFDKEYLLVYYYTPSKLSFFNKYTNLYVGKDNDLTWKVYLISIKDLKQLYNDIHNNHSVKNITSAFFFLKITTDKFNTPEEYIDFYKDKTASYLDEETYGIKYEKLNDTEIKKIIKNNEIK